MSTAAYGVPAAMVEPEKFAGLAEVDSVSLDAHKWLLPAARLQPPAVPGPGRGAPYVLDDGRLRGLPHQ